MDAWGIIVAHAADTSDAWTALNSQQVTGSIPGVTVELPFTIGGPIQLVIAPTVIGGFSMQAQELRLNTSPSVISLGVSTPAVAFSMAARELRLDITPPVQAFSFYG